MDSRQRIAQRVLAEHMAIAEHLRADPDRVLDYVRGNIDRWAAGFSSGRSPNWLIDWQKLLTGPREALLEVMTADTDAAARLRATSPFVGLLTVPERLKILRRLDPAMARNLELHEAPRRPAADAL